MFLNNFLSFLFLFFLLNKMSCCNSNKKINDINSIKYNIPVDKMRQNSKENYMYMNTYGDDNTNDCNINYVNNYCTFYNNGQRQAVLALQDNDNPLTYKAFLA
jgi:hypothetical protein